MISTVSPIERAKELNCLYDIDKVLQIIDKDIPIVIKEILDIIPSGFRYFDLCEAEIILGDKIYSRPGLVRTELMQMALIKAYGEIIGEIRVFYVKPVKSEKGIFLAEEVQMLNSIAEKIAMFVTLQKLKPSSIEFEIGEDEAKIYQNLSYNYPEMITWLRKMGLKQKEITQMLRNPLTFKKGETIGKQGAFTSYFILLAKGTVKSYIEGPGNKSYSFMLTLPSEFIGISSLFGNQYHFSTVALIPSTVFLIEKDIVLKIIGENQKFNKNIMAWLCDNYKIIFHKMSCLSLKQTIGRMAEVILYLSNDVFKSDVIPAYISRKDLAELSGMSNENAVRILSDFKSENILKDTPEGLKVLNSSLLQTISITG